MPENDPNIHKEHLRGRYAIITASITLIGVIITARFGPVNVNVNLDEYVKNYNASSPQYDEQDTYDLSLQKQNSELQKEIFELNDEISALKTEIAALNELNVTLQDEKSALEKRYTELQKYSQGLLDKLAAEGIPSESNFISSSDPPGSNTSASSLKLTSLPVLANRYGYMNHVYDSPQNTTDAISNVGGTFDSCISMRRSGDIDFYLNCEYQWLNATICLSAESKNVSDYSSTITIFKVEGNGDTEVLTAYYSSPPITMGFTPDKIGPIDVSDVEHLRIHFSSTGSISRAPGIILGDPVLTPK